MVRSNAKTKKSEAENNTLNKHNEEVDDTHSEFTEVKRKKAATNIR